MPVTIRVQASIMLAAAATTTAAGLGSSLYLLPPTSKSFDLFLIRPSKWPSDSSVSRRLCVAAAEKKPQPTSSLSESRTQIPDSLQPPFIESSNESGESNEDGIDLGWLPAFPHVLTASMANFVFGYHIGVMNGPIVSLARELGFEGNPLLEGLVVSIFIASAFIGSLSSGLLVDSLGFRRTFQITAIPLMLGALLRIIAQAHSPDEVLLGRFLVGLGIGVNAALVPIYISEVSPTRYRGFLGTICQIGTCLGIILSLLLGIPSENDPHWWRTMLYIASLPAFLLIFGLHFVAESPRWLCKVGRSNDAKRIIRNLWGESEVDSSIEEIQSVIRNDTSESSWLELTMEPHRRVAFIGGALFVLQQFAGINGVLYFSSLTFHDVGITSGATASFFVGLTNLAGALFALYLMDKQGRKKLIIGSYLGMAASMFLITYSIGSPMMDEQLSRMLPVLGTLMYMFTFAIGAGPVTGLIIPELSSARTRAKIMGFSFSVHWVCNFLVGLFFLELVEMFGVGPVYATFGGVSLLAALFSGYFLVETKGRSLEEIEMSLLSGLKGNDSKS